MRRLFPHKFNKSPFNQNSKLTIGEVSFILKQTVVYYCEIDRIGLTKTWAKRFPG